MTIETLLPVFAFVAVISVMVLGTLLVAFAVAHRESGHTSTSDLHAAGAAKNSATLRLGPMSAVFLSLIFISVLVGLTFLLESIERTERHTRPQTVAATPTAEVITEAEVIAVAAAEPKIDLDSDSDAYRRQALEAAQKDWDAERIRANDEAYGADAEAKRIKFLEAALSETDEGPKPEKASKDTDKKRPAWVNGDVTESQTVITSGPFTTPVSCAKDTHQQIIELVTKKAEGLGLDDRAVRAVRQEIDKKARSFPPPFVKETHLSEITTSVALVYIQYSLVELGEDEIAWINAIAEAGGVEYRRIYEIQSVTLLGAGLVSLVALAHLVLRAGGQKPKASAS